ncbi:hypothetical protein [Tahibacter amnicola]|uniref:EamA-like transporter family protein n=1 Tax=Tahibacter amnicola TaxID=2976241 RepID=A0ABY6BJ60_9GAMM|nr:hypothetical protein [Tahibacter amnicola]UXI69914.1 hypothetical protein N4264_09885 [Tahibacter amnicola]
MTTVSKAGAAVWVVAAALVVVFAVVGIDPKVRLYYSNVMQTLLSLAAAFLCFRTVFALPEGSPLRKVWGLIGGGVLAWGIGATVFASYPLLNDGKETPFPSLADVGYLLTSPLIAAGLLVFTRSTGLVAPLWGKAVALALFGISFAIAIWANWPGLTSGAPLLVLTAGCYALFDPVLLGVTVMTASAFRGGEIAQAWWYLLAGILLYYAGNQIYNYLSVTKQYATGSPIDVGWLLGFGLIAIAAVKIRSLMT